MAHAYIVAGMALGDEAKGATVDALCRSLPIGLIVRYNGGCQAAHYVTLQDGTAHCFSQFGAGMLANTHVRTHLSRFMLVEPIAMMREAEALNKITENVWWRTTVDGEAVVVQVLGDGPGDADAVKGARAAADFVEYDQAVAGGVVQDIGRLLHLDHERAAAAGQVIARAHAREDAIQQRDAGALGRHERTHMRQDGDHGHHHDGDNHNDLTRPRRRLRVGLQPWCFASLSLHEQH